MKAVAIRQALIAATLTLAASAAGAAETLPRLTGELNYANYPAVAQYLSKTVGKPLALDITIPADNDETDGHLTAFVLDGQFELAYLAGKGSSKIYSDANVELVNDTHYTLQGVFTVQKGGADADVPYLALEPADVSNATFEDVSIAGLKLAE